MELTTFQKKKKEYIEYHCERRFELWYIAKAHPEKHERLKQNLAREPIEFINDWVWTFDPRNIEIGLPTKIPLYMFDRQRELVEYVIETFKESENGLIEKSRDMGMTWVMCAIFAHFWLFEKGFKVGIGSRKLALVDTLGSMDAIFPKIRWIIDNLPEWLKPKGYRKDKDDNYCKIINPENGSMITGEGGYDIGRGGRNTIYFVDEHAKVEHAEMTDAALSQNTNCIIYGSTPMGMGNLFAKKRFSDKVKVFTMHWRDHPFKDDNWYKKECSKYDAVTIAQEIDIDYSASAEGIIIPSKWVRKAVNLKLEKSGIKACGIDVGGGTGSGEAVYIERTGSVAHSMKTYTRKEPTEFALLCANFAEESSLNKFQYDAIGVGAGIHGTIKKRDKPFKPKIVPIQSGSKPTNRKYDDAPELRAKDRFVNLRAEMWWSLRERFRKTNAVVTYMDQNNVDLETACESLKFKEDELISIPDDNELIVQLSLPTMETASSGKMKVESKEDMSKRNIKSPDRADALVYCFSDVQSPKRVIPSTHSTKTYN